MYTTDFDYHRATSVQNALELLAANAAPNSSRADTRSCRP